MQGMYETKEYRQSRSAYKVFCMLEYFIALLVSDAYLSKLLGQVGMDDMQIGVISSLITAAFLFQLFSIGLVKKIQNVKNAC